MVVSTHDGQVYEDQTDYLLDHPMNDDLTSRVKSGEGTYNPKTDVYEANPNKELYFVRHGDTDLNEESGEKSHDQPIRGWSDVSLNADGRKEAKKASKSVKDLDITHIVSSDLPRAKETARIIGKEIGITPDFHPGLRTWDLGDLTESKGKEAHDQVDHYCQDAKDERPPGSSESFNEFTNRIIDTTKQIANEHPDEHRVLIVSHNSPERALHAWDAAGQPDSNSIDQDAYHEKGIEPGKHKIFNIQSSFGDRFQGMPLGLPQKVPGESFEGTPSLYHPSLRSPTAFPEERYNAPQDFINPLFNPDTDRNSLLNYTSNEEPAQFSPKQFIPSRPEGEASRYIQGMGDTLADQILSVLKDPSQIVGPGELGIFRKIPGIDKIIKEGLAAGKSFPQLGRELGVDPTTVKRQADNLGLKSKNKFGPQGLKDVPDWFKEEMKHTDPEEGLSDWYKNQFEGGPIEPENLKNQYPEVYKKMMEEFEKKSPEDFNTANRDVTQLQRPANENVKDKDTIEHPLMNLFEHWVNPPKKSPGQEAYEKAAAKQGRKGKGFVAEADRNQYPITYNMKDNKLEARLDHLNRFLEAENVNWKKEGFEPDMFKLEFRQAHAEKAELEERLNGIVLKNAAKLSPELQKLLRDLPGFPKDE